MRIVVVVKESHFHKSKIKQLLEALKSIRETHVIVGQSILTTQAELKRHFRKEDTLIIIGGDGTIHHTIQALDEFFKNKTCPTLAIFPFGSGNDFVRTFKIPKEIKTWLEMFKAQKSTSIDIGFIEAPHNRYYLTSTSIGVSADASQLALRPSMLPPRLKYLWATFVAITRVKKFELHLSTPNSQIETHPHTMHGVIANTPFFGSGIVSAKDAIPHDGKQNFIGFCGSVFYVARHVVSILRGHVSNLRCTRATQSPTFTVNTIPPTTIQADGEVIGTTPMTVKTLPKALLLITP